MNYTLFYMNCFPEQMNDTFFEIFFFKTPTHFRFLGYKNGFSIDFFAFTWLYFRI